MMDFMKKKVAVAAAFGAGLLAVAHADDTQAVLNAIKTHHFGDSRTELIRAEAWVQSVLGNADHSRGLALAMADLLDDADTTFEGKQFVCRQLVLIGSAENVPALAALLGDEKTASAARIALERIPDAKVDDALVQALGESDGLTRVGIINTLGDRHCVNALDAVAPLVYDEDTTTACAAISALAKMGAPAAKALTKAKKSDAPNQRALSDALILVAEDMVITGDPAGAKAIFSSLNSEDEEAPVRKAAALALEKMEAKPKQ